MGLNISNEGGSLERLCLGLERLCQDKAVVSICNIKKRSYIHTYIVIFLGNFCPRGKGARGYPYVKHQTRRDDTMDSHNTGKLHALLFSNIVWFL